MQNQIKNNYVLGFDPGYDRLGVSVFDCKNKKIIFSICIKTNKNKSDTQRLLNIYKEVKSILEKYEVKIAGIEKLFFSKNTKTASFVYQTIGVIKILLLKKNIDILEYTPQKIKLAITGYGNADKKFVYFMLKKQIDIPDKLIDDEVDAIAVAFTTCFYKKTK